MSDRSIRIRRAINKLPESARAILDLNSTRFSLSVGSDPERRVQSGESGADIVVTIYGPSMKGNIKLTSLDYDGLVALKEFFDIAFANAQPIVQARDREAQEAYENGDDSYKRLDTIVPRIVVREGTKWEHYPVLRRGFEWVASLDSFIKVRTVNVRDPSGSVSHGDKEDIIRANYQ